MRDRISVLLLFVAVSALFLIAMDRLGLKAASKQSAVLASALSSSSTPTRILCYGDSLTAGTAPMQSNLFPYAPHLESTLKQRGNNVMVRHRGLPGWTSSQMVQDADSSTAGLRPAIRAAMPIAIVIILAGTNDLGYSNDPLPIVDNILALHKLCHEEEVPHTLAVGVPPSGYQSENAEAAALANAVNQKLQEYCESESKATFVPFPFEFARDDDKWAYDGLHFTAKGYQVLGESLAPAVERILTES